MSPPGHAARAAIPTSTPSAHRALPAPLPAIARLARRARAWRYDRWFARADSGFPFAGAYDTFDAAVAAAPRTKPVGFDQPAAAAVYVDEMTRMAPSDYPVVYWLSRIVHPALQVFDFGGHVGTKYRAFARYLAYPDAMRWQVCDVPSIVEAGRVRAARDALPQLEFTTRFADADGADVLLASGALQYVPDPPWVELARLPRPPRHLLLNKLPVRDGPAFVTLQNIQVAFVPYTVFSESELLDRLADLGYALVDRWDVLDRRTVVPFHPERTSRHIGLFLSREGDAFAVAAGAPDAPPPSAAGTVS